MVVVSGKSKVKVVSRSVELSLSFQVFLREQRAPLLLFPSPLAFSKFKSCPEKSPLVFEVDAA